MSRITSSRASTERKNTRIRPSFVHVFTLALCASSEICRKGTKPDSTPCFALLPLMFSPLPVASPSIIMRSASNDVGRQTAKKLEGSPDGCNPLA